MRPEIVNRNKDSIFHGDYVGRDNIAVNIVMLQDSEREFVVTHNANIKPVSYFTGRETELQELRQRIEAGRKSVLVSGMGGIGKTHICRKLFEEYLNKHAGGENGPFRYLGYIEYNGDMGSSLQNCLKFKQQDSPEQNQEAAWRELEYLAADGKLLLFVDNVDRLIGEDSGLQRLRGIPGAVVLTSRQASFSDEFEPYRIGFLDMGQCKEVYERIRFEGSGKKVRREEVLDLEYVIENLAGRHTITVELLAHLAWTKIWTVKRLREKLEEKGFRMTFRKDGEFVNIQEAYEVLYDLSKLTEAEQNILEAFSVFPYIPLAAETCNEWLLADAGVSEDDDILMGLYQKGWLQFNVTQERFALHPVFAQFIYEKCEPRIHNHLGLVNASRESLKIPQSGSIIECQWYIPFAESIIKNMDIQGYVKREEFVKGLYNSLKIPEGGLDFGYEEFAPSAEDLFEKVVVGRGREQAKFIDALADSFAGKEEYSKAKYLYQNSINIWMDIEGEEGYHVAVCYNKLANVYRDLGKYRRSEELHIKAIKIFKSILSENHPDVASEYNNLAILYGIQGEYKKAEQLCKKGLEIRRNILPNEHSDIANSYRALADICQRQGDYKKAEELIGKSIKIWERVGGENHLRAATGYNSLAAIYLNQGKYKKAQELFEKSLKIIQKLLGEDHTRTANIYNNMAGLYYVQKQYSIAEKLYRKCLSIYERVFGECHPNTAEVYNSLAYVYYNQGAYDQTMSLLEKSV